MDLTRRVGKRTSLFSTLVVDVSILIIDTGVFEVLATNGDTHLGGKVLITLAK